MIEFKRDETGRLYSVKDGIVTGIIVTMGDYINEEKEDGTSSRYRDKE